MVNTLVCDTRNAQFNSGYAPQKTMKINKTKIYKKAWGQENWLVNSKDYCGKILSLKKDHFCSLHKHEIKKETFYVLNGKVWIAFYNLNEKNYKVTVLNKGDTINIPVGVYHSFFGLENSQIIEISTEHFENDSYRLFKSGKGSSHYWLSLLEEIAKEF